MNNRSKTRSFKQGYQVRLLLLGELQDLFEDHSDVRRIALQGFSKKVISESPAVLVSAIESRQELVKCCRTDIEDLLFSPLHWGHRLLRVWIDTFASHSVRNKTSLFRTTLTKMILKGIFSDLNHPTHFRIKITSRKAVSLMEFSNPVRKNVGSEWIADSFQVERNLVQSHTILVTKEQ